MFQRFSSSPRGSIRRGEDGSRIAHRHEESVSVGDSPERSFDVPEVLEFHVVPSEEVRMVPERPTDTKILFS